MTPAVRTRWSLVYGAAQLVDDRNDEEEAGPTETDVAAQAKHGDLLPLIGDFDGEEEQRAGDDSGEEKRRFPG